MRELLRSEAKPEIYKLLASLGQIAQKPDIALFGVKMLLREVKLRPFLFEIPQMLRAMLYPQPYSAYVEKYAKKNQLEKAEVYALIRQESQFFEGAISVANAQGLMQILPATAKLLAAKEGLSNYNLLKPEDNIRLGTSFMREIRSTYAADFVGLAIAYNAGPGRLLQWRKKYSHDDDIFVEEIPFQETYHYVRVLLADRARYRALLAEK
jgi:soluble lytic murein transglycosylase